MSECWKLEQGERNILFQKKRKGNFFSKTVKHELFGLCDGLVLVQSVLASFSSAMEVEWSEVIGLGSMGILKVPNKVEGSIKYSKHREEEKAH